MEEEIVQLKSVLRSLVVSSPTQVDVRSLLRDYRNMIGSTVPVRKYGYNNPVDFFKERFSDCFLFSGAATNPVLTLIVPETLKHIDKFVQKQKSSSTNKFNPKRRSVAEELVNKNGDKILSKTNNKKHGLSQPIELSKESHEKSSSQQIWPTKSHIPVNKPSTPPTPSKSFASGSKMNVSCSKLHGTTPFKSVNNVPHTDHTKHNEETNVVKSPEVLEDKDTTESETEDIPMNSTDAVKKFLKKRLPLYQSEQYLQEETAEQCSKTLHDDASGKNTSSSGGSAKAQQLEQLKEEILALITDAPDGVSCTDLIKLYKERYNRELNYHRFGYTSILSLVYSLEQRVQVSRPDATGDWLLQDRRRAQAQAAPRARRRVAVPAAVLNQLVYDSDDALPGIAFDPDVFPEDCMLFMDRIESIIMTDFRPGAMVEVMVGEVYSPSHFWFLRLGEKYNIAMEDMMDEMTHYYRNEGRNRVLARGAVRVGHYCASVYERDWHRSVIVNIIDSDTVKVRHIDYGTVDTLAVSALKPLKRSWAALPAQACRARLAGVRPSAAGWRWPHAAATAFLALVTNRRLVANVVAVDLKDKVAEVLLIDTASERDVCIGTELVRAGHADARHDSALHTLEVYLFPRFEALESGATPNYGEVHAYLRDGIALDYVPEYRDHVPLPLPPHAPPDSDSPRSPHDQNSPHKSESPDSSEFINKALYRSPTSSETGGASTDDTESTFESGVPLRIPLLLPETPKSRSAQTETEPATAAEPASPPTPTRSSERPALLPTPTSYLSPYAPAYVPRAPYRGPAPPCPASPCPAAPCPAAPCPPGCVRPVPPPCGSLGMPLRPPGVTLSLNECETYRALSHVNPAAAHWFIVGAMGRATAVDLYAPPLYSVPPPARAPPPPPPHTYPEPRLQVHPPVRIRPPPGFRSF